MEGRFINHEERPMPDTSTAAIIASAQNMNHADRPTDGNVRLADDLLWGVPVIAREIGRTEAQVYNMLSQGLLPATKVGKLWTSKRSALRARFETQAA
ncbi:MAG TPA: hypothetical protein VGY14_05825 [Methyloceanibacter sp.]|jgi:hypothetical protein|nr:hypothetical protein [Methyloceanibacter sp.]